MKNIRYIIRRGIQGDIYVNLCNDIFNGVSNDIRREIYDKLEYNMQAMIYMLKSQ